jgi:hypothetical protein
MMSRPLAVQRRTRPASEFQVRRGPGYRHRSFGSGRRQQRFCVRVQVFPSRFGQGRLRADQVANHLPRRQVQSAIGRWTHGQRDGALRAKAYATRRRFLPRAHSRRLGEQEYGDRFLARFEFPITTKAKWIVQRFRPLRAVQLAMQITLSKPSLLTQV